ncbi:MAG: FKBP-type peptidyl-prolyl cis-trans isomerase [Bacteroidales bacterium]|nr:FKBP-type peptidyl-prolyl cis-trans isomerase [Bacteroidales bacterium]
MKKNVITLLSAGLLLCCSCKGGNNPVVPLSSGLDTLSYCLGLDIGTYLQSTTGRLDGDQLEMEKVIAGIEDFRNGTKRFNEDYCAELLRHYFVDIYPEKALCSSRTFLIDIEKTTPGIYKTGSGLFYKIITPGKKNKQLTVNDRVLVIYEGRRRDGTVFDSSGSDTGDLPLDVFIPGIQEGLGLIGPGGKIKLWVPPALGYGRDGNENLNIGPNQALSYDIELISVMH